MCLGLEISKGLSESLFGLVLGVPGGEWSDYDLIVFWYEFICWFNKERWEMGILVMFPLNAFVMSTLLLSILYRSSFYVA